MAKFNINAKDSLQKLETRLNTRLKNVESRNIAVLLKGGYLIEARAKKKTPREYGNLVNSGYTRKAQNNPLAVEVGFTAAYALPVHEKVAEKLRGKPRPSGLGTYWSPGESKFLAKAFYESVNEIVAMVRNASRL